MGFLFAVVVLLTVWATLALYFDFPVPPLRVPAAVIYAVALTAVFIFVHDFRWKIAAGTLCFAVVAIWWLSIKPSNDRPWQADVSQMPWAEFHQDTVIIHNFRHCEYRAEFDYTCAWLTKEVKLSDIRGIDLSLTYWGSPWIAHTILSFQVGDDDHIAMSIETRKVIGQQYSAIQGFFRRYTLVYVIADERDLIRLRTNFRKNEDVYLYHTNAKPEYARALFVEYLKRANDLHDHPKWYNALTENCTTVIFRQMSDLRLEPPPVLDWRVILNGHMDEMEYERGNLAGNLPFDQLKRAALINPAAHAAEDSPDFSRLIRQGRPGFESLDTKPAPSANR
ncbi:MAG: DUF4105 domain-containing protein [Candidatus Acidiferrales bacterium]